MHVAYGIPHSTEHYVGGAKKTPGKGDLNEAFSKYGREGDRHKASVSGTTCWTHATASQVPAT